MTLSGYLSNQKHQSLIESYHTKIKENGHNYLVSYLLTFGIDNLTRKCEDIVFAIIMGIPWDCAPTDLQLRIHRFIGCDNSIYLNQNEKLDKMTSVRLYPLSPTITSWIDSNMQIELYKGNFYNLNDGVSLYIYIYIYIYRIFYQYIIKYKIIAGIVAEH